MTNQTVSVIVRNNFYLFMQRAFAELNPGTKFMANWHLQALCYVLYLCWIGEIKRLIVTIPPRHCKSISASVALPAFIHGHDPTQRIIVTSYGNSLAAQLSNDTRRVMKAPWYRATFPSTVIDAGKDTEDLFRTTKGGYRLATSVGGGVTGLGGNWIIIDDPLKATALPSEADLKRANEYYGSTLYSRLDNKKAGCIILIMQRLHEDDLAGHLLQQPGWYHLHLPAIAEKEQDIPIGDGQVHTRQPGDLLHPERESQADLDTIKSQMGPYAFAAQYQQRPAPMGGGIIEWHWLKHYDDLPNHGKGGYIVQSWDTALSIKEGASYSVCTTWFCYEGHYYLTHVWRDRLKFPELKAVVQSHALKHRADLVIIELNNCSNPLIESLRKHTTLNTAYIEPKGSKAERMIGETGLLSDGRVHVPKQADWLDTFRNEVVRFPMSKHDDQVDSLSQFLYWARKGGEKHPTGWGFPGLGLPENGNDHGMFSQVTVITPDPGPLDLSDLY
jgi:predicted phage terminase large subunit-like protein